MTQAHGPATAAADPGLADPGLADPGLADPGLADPGLADPGLADQGLADAGLADPGVATAVWSALGAVLDPELDEPITGLGFVETCTVTGDGVALIRLRLPTFFCAPNFSFLMVADAYDAVTAVDGVRRAEVSLLDHHASAEINAGVAGGLGFVGSFAGEATGELHDLRAQFLRKAVVAGQDRVARPLVDAGATPARLAELTLGDVPPSPDLRRLRERRALLGIDAGDDAPLLVHPDGSPVTPAQVPLHLRRARLTRVGIETNGEYCRSLLDSRYPAGASVHDHQ